MRAIADECRALATAAGLDWTEIFPKQKRVLVAGRDVAAALRDAEFDVDTPALRTYLTRLITRLRPTETTHGVSAAIRDVLNDVERARSWHVRSQSSRDNRDVLATLTANEAAFYAQMLASTLGKALGANVVAKRDSQRFGDEVRWAIDVS